MELLYFQSFLFLFLVSVSLYLICFNLSQIRKSPNKNNGFRSCTILGKLPEFLKNRHRLLDWFAETLAAAPNNTAFFSVPGSISGLVTASPANVEHVLRENFHNYPKGEVSISMLGDLLGDGILNADGELWRSQRKTASHEFKTTSLKNFVMRTVSVETETRLVPILEEASVSGRVLDLQDVLERFAFDNICKLAFGIDPGCLAGEGSLASAGEEFMKALNNAAELSAGRFRYAILLMWKVKRYFNIGSEKSLRESISVVHRFTDNIVQSRIEEAKEKLEGKEDLLSRFIEKDEKCSPEFLRDIVISFIIAGRDSSSSALSWFFWLISSRPDVQEKVLNELRTIRAQNGKCNRDSYTYDELRDMQYLYAAISESMRLYPPVPANVRRCLNDDVLPDGTFVAKGWIVSFHNYTMGRMESIWGKDCLEFRPERWLGEDGRFRQESPFRFPVFHGGPRMCLGKEMANIQMKFIAATVIERFEINVLGKEKCPDNLFSLTLRMKDGLPVTMRKRGEVI